MKLRIRGNSVRLRVSKTELDSLLSGGTVEDSVAFGPAVALRYGIEITASGSLSAHFDGQRLMVHLPRALALRWQSPEEVGVEAEQPTGEAGSLRILVEKDYTCLAPRSGEDDSDLFDNPMKRRTEG